MLSLPFTALLLALAPCAWAGELEFAMPSSGTPHLDGAVATPRYGGALVATTGFAVGERNGHLGMLGVFRPGLPIEFAVGMTKLSYDLASGDAPVFSPGPLVFAVRVAEIPTLPDVAVVLGASARPARLPTYDEPMRLSARVAYGHDLGPVRPIFNIGATYADRAEGIGGVGATADLPSGFELAAEVYGSTDGHVLGGGSIGLTLRGDTVVALGGWHDWDGAASDTTVMMRIDARYTSKGMALAHRSDRDGDGVVDASDACPSRWGNRQDGCFLPPCDCGLDTMQDVELQALGERLGNPPAGIAFVFELGVVASGDAELDWRRTQKAAKVAEGVLEHYAGYPVIIMLVEPSPTGTVDFIPLPYGSVTTYMKTYGYRGPAQP